jgi:hypothetical protein
VLNVRFPLSFFETATIVFSIIYLLYAYIRMIFIFRTESAGAHETTKKSISFVLRVSIALTVVFLVLFVPLLATTFAAAELDDVSVKLTTYSFDFVACFASFLQAQSLLCLILFSIRFCILFH